MNKFDFFTISNTIGFFLIIYGLYKLFFYIRDRYSLSTALLVFAIFLFIGNGNDNKISKEEISEIVNNILLEKNLIKSENFDVIHQEIDYKLSLFQNINIWYDIDKITKEIRKINSVNSYGFNASINFAKPQEIIKNQERIGKNKFRYYFVVNYNTKVFMLFDYNDSIIIKKDIDFDKN